MCCCAKNVHLLVLYILLIITAVAGHISRAEHNRQQHTHSGVHIEPQHIDTTSTTPCLHVDLPETFTIKSSGNSWQTTIGIFVRNETKPAYYMLRRCPSYADDIEWRDIHGNLFAFTQIHSWTYQMNIYNCLGSNMYMVRGSSFQPRSGPDGSQHFILTQQTVMSPNSSFIAYTDRRYDKEMVLRDRNGMIIASAKNNPLSSSIDMTVRIHEAKNFAGDARLISLLIASRFIQHGGPDGCTMFIYYVIPTTIGFALVIFAWGILASIDHYNTGYRDVYVMLPQQVL